MTSGRHFGLPSLVVAALALLFLAVPLIVVAHTDSLQPAAQQETKRAAVARRRSVAQSSASAAGSDAAKASETATTAEAADATKTESGAASDPDPSTAETPDPKAAKTTTNAAPDPKSDSKSDPKTHSQPNASADPTAIPPPNDAPLLHVDTRQFDEEARAADKELQGRLAEMQKQFNEDAAAVSQKSAQDHSPPPAAPRR